MIHWIIGTTAIKLLASAGASATLLSTAFGGHGNYVYGAGSGYGSRTVVVTSIEEAKSAAPHRYAYAIADIEKWGRTPVSQQQDPAGTIRQIAAIFAHDGTRVIGAPAANLFGGWQGYLDSGVTSAAQWTYGWEVQDQTQEFDPSTYAKWFFAALGQARAANRHVQMLTGLTTDQRSGTVTGDVLIAAYRAVIQLGAQGVWLNVPDGPGTSCPNCTPANPGPAVRLLKSIYS